MTNTFSSNLLGALPFSHGVVTRQINAENPTGGKGAAAKWDPDPTNPDLPHSGASVDLGRGWKVHPFIKVFAGQTVTLAEIDGSGCINEFWIASDLPEFRAFILRIYWDNEETPSVEVPLGDFFAMGHDTAPHTVVSLPVHVGPYRACSCYWQMPFRKHARITLENQGPKDSNVVAYRFLYKLYDIPEDAAYFHAQWRRSTTRREYPEHVILDGVVGRGLYVGTYLAWNAYSRGWWGEGEVKFYIDGDKEFPTICDNGTEDYFGGAWGFCHDPKNDPNEQEFNSPFLGMPLAHYKDPQSTRKFSLYRWHILDSIGFTNNLKVTIQALGWWPNGRYQPLTDDIASVAYWYQLEPHQPFPQVLAMNDRWDR